MKKLMQLFIVVLCFCSTIACADSKRVIRVTELPKVTQTFLDKHFHNVKVNVVIEEKETFGREYKVSLANGFGLKFDKKGNWEEVECRTSAVPSAIIPEPIMNYVKKNYPGEIIRKIDRDKKGYEVKLSNGMELEFDAKCRLLNVGLD